MDFFYTLHTSDSFWHLKRIYALEKKGETLCGKHDWIIIEKLRRHVSKFVDIKKNLFKQIRNLMFIGIFIMQQKKP